MTESIVNDIKYFDNYEIFVESLIYTIEKNNKTNKNRNITIFLNSINKTITDLPIDKTPNAKIKLVVDVIYNRVRIINKNNTEQNISEDFLKEFFDDVHVNYKVREKIYNDDFKKIDEYDIKTHLSSLILSLNKNIRIDKYKLPKHFNTMVNTMVDSVKDDNGTDEYIKINKLRFKIKNLFIQISKRIIKGNIRDITLDEFYKSYLKLWENVYDDYNVLKELEKELEKESEKESEGYEENKCNKIIIKLKTLHDTTDQNKYNEYFKTVRDKLKKRFEDTHARFTSIKSDDRTIKCESVYAEFVQNKKYIEDLNKKSELFKRIYSTKKIEEITQKIIEINKKNNNKKTTISINEKFNKLLKNIENKGKDFEDMGDIDDFLNHFNSIDFNNILNNINIYYTNKKDIKEDVDLATDINTEAVDKTEAVITPVIVSTTATENASEAVDNTEAVITPVIVSTTATENASEANTANGVTPANGAAIVSTTATDTADATTNGLADGANTATVITKIPVTETTAEAKAKPHAETIYEGKSETTIVPITETTAEEKAHADAEEKAHADAEAKAHADAEKKAKADNRMSIFGNIFTTNTIQQYNYNDEKQITNKDIVNKVISYVKNNIVIGNSTVITGNTIHIIDKKVIENILSTATNTNEINKDIERHLNKITELMNDGILVVNNYDNHLFNNYVRHFSKELTNDTEIIPDTENVTSKLSNVINVIKNKFISTPVANVALNEAAKQPLNVALNEAAKPKPNVANTVPVVKTLDEVTTHTLAANIPDKEKTTPNQAEVVKTQPAETNPNGITDCINNDIIDIMHQINIADNITVNQEIELGLLKTLQQNFMKDPDSLILNRKIFTFYGKLFKETLNFYNYDDCLYKNMLIEKGHKTKEDVSRISDAIKESIDMKVVKTSNFPFFHNISSACFINAATSMMFQIPEFYKLLIRFDVNHDNMYHPIPVYKPVNSSIDYTNLYSTLEIEKDIVKLVNQRYEAFKGIISQIKYYYNSDENRDMGWELSLSRFLFLLDKIRTTGGGNFKNFRDFYQTQSSTHEALTELIYAFNQICNEQYQNDKIYYENAKKEDYNMESFLGRGFKSQREICNKCMQDTHTPNRFGGDSTNYEYCINIDSTATEQAKIIDLFKKTGSLYRNCTYCAENMYNYLQGMLFGNYNKEIFNIMLNNNKSEADLYSLAEEKFGKLVMSNHKGLFNNFKNKLKFENIGIEEYAPIIQGITINGEQHLASLDTLYKDKELKDEFIIYSVLLYEYIYNNTEYIKKGTEKPNSTNYSNFFSTRIDKTNTYNYSKHILLGRTDNFTEGRIVTSDTDYPTDFSIIQHDETIKLTLKSYILHRPGDKTGQDVKSGHYYFCSINGEETHVYDDNSKYRIEPKFYNKEQGSIFHYICEYV